jgi:hypothetical protein
LKGERKNMTKKNKLSEFKDAQSKRLLNFLIKPITPPFSYEVVFITNRSVDIE